MRPVVNLSNFYILAASTVAVKADSLVAVLADKQYDIGGSAAFCFRRILFSAACWCFFSSALSIPLCVA